MLSWDSFFWGSTTKPWLGALAPVTHVADFYPLQRLQSPNPLQTFLLRFREDRTSWLSWLSWHVFCSFPRALSCESFIRTSPMRKNASPAPSHHHGCCCFCSFAAIASLISCSHALFFCAGLVSWICKVPETALQRWLDDGTSVPWDVKCYGHWRNWNWHTLVPQWEWAIRWYHWHGMKCSYKL